MQQKERGPERTGSTRAAQPETDERMQDADVRENTNTVLSFSCSLD